MKKTIAVLLTLVMIFSLAAGGSSLSDDITEWLVNNGIIE